MIIVNSMASWDGWDDAGRVRYSTLQGAGEAKRDERTEVEKLAHGNPEMVDLVALEYGK